MVTKEIDQYTVDCNLLSKNVTVEDAGKYKVTARNDLGESNATITLNFDSKATKPFNTIIYQFCTEWETHNVKEYIHICSAYKNVSKDLNFTLSIQNEISL